MNQVLRKWERFMDWCVEKMGVEVTATTILVLDIAVLVVIAVLADQLISTG